MKDKQGAAAGPLLAALASMPLPHAVVEHMDKGERYTEEAGSVVDVLDGFTIIYLLIYPLNRVDLMYGKGF
jgi:hypothetical protein